MNKIRALTLDSLNENIFSTIKNRVSGMFRKRRPFVPTPPSDSQKKALTRIGRSNVAMQKGSEALSPRYAALSHAHKEKLGDVFRANLADRDIMDFRKKLPGTVHHSGGPAYKRLRGVGGDTEHAELRRNVDIRRSQGQRADTKTFDRNKMV